MIAQKIDSINEVISGKEVMISYLQKLLLNFKQKKADSQTAGGLAMRKARIFNYYNKRSHKGTKTIIEHIL